MIYTLIISLLIEKPFYLLRSQSFSFQIVSEFIDIFVKFSNFMSRGDAFDSLFRLEGRVFVHNDCPGGRVFAPFKSCPRGEWFWMKLIPALNETNAEVSNIFNVVKRFRKAPRTWKHALIRRNPKKTLLRKT